MLPRRMGHATAASIWTVRIIGAAVGYGYYDIGIILTAANLIILMLRMRSSGHSSRRQRPGVRAFLDHDQAGSPLP